MTVKAGDIVFRTGDPGDALYIVAHGVVEVLNGSDQRTLAELGDGQAFGEMALLSDGTRTATIRAKTDTRLLAIGKDDFDRLVAEDPFLDEQVRKLSHERAIANLRSGDVNPALWVQTARESVDRLSRSEEHRLLQEAKQGKGAGLAIVFGNILDTIPGCLVIGAKFAGFESLSFTLILGIFLGGIPEAAASATMLRKAGYSDRTIFLLWSTVLAAGVVAAVAGKLFINGSESMAAVLAQAVAAAIDAIGANSPRGAEPTLTSSSDGATSFRYVTAHPPHTPPSVKGSRPVPPSSPAARITSSMPSWTSSSTTTCRSSRRSRARSMNSRMACSIERFIRPRSIVCTCSVASCCACESQSVRSSMFATGWSTPTRCRSTPRCNLCFAMSPTISGACRRTSTLCARCWLSPSRQA